MLGPSTTSLLVRIDAKDPEMEHLAAAHSAKSLLLCFCKRVCESLHLLEIRISDLNFTRPRVLTYEPTVSILLVSSSGNSQTARATAR